MFVRRSEPVALTEEGLDGLCPSLNRPVVDAGGMPVGPARAIIALHRDLSGQRLLLVAVRSEDSGSVTTFEFDGELNTAPHLALDAGLTFAEGMGFLFDEDMLIAGGPDGRRRALESWCELTGDDLPEPIDLAIFDLPGVEIPPEDGALQLEDLVDSIEDDLSEELLLPGEPLPDSAVLSKFRVKPVAPGLDPNIATPNPEDSAPAQLGRIQLQKRKPVEAAEPPLLARLLARF